MSQKLRLQVLSDLHLEGTAYNYAFDKRAEFLVLAGDIGNAIGNLEVAGYRRFLADQSQRYTKIFLLGGNKEYKGLKRIGPGGKDGDAWAAGNKQMRQFAEEFPKVEFLQQNVFDMTPYGHKVIVLGCTLWSRTRRDQPRAIAGDRATIGLWSTAKNNHLFELDYQWIKDTVARIRSGSQTQNYKIVVITHHTPCFGTSESDRDHTGSRWSGFQNDILGGEGVEGLGKGDVVRSPPTIPRNFPMAVLGGHDPPELQVFTLLSNANSSNV